MLIGLGLVLVVIFFIATFALSLILGVPDTDPPPAHGFLILAVIMGLCSFFASRFMKPANRKQAVTHGVVWAVIAVVVILGIAIPNQTTAKFFGNWGVYFVFVGIALGPAFVKAKPSPSNPPVINQ